MPTVRYIADDVGGTAHFYVEHLGFHIDLQPAPGFAILSRGDLRLLLNAPGAGGAGQAASDGAVPEPGGWSRFQLDLGDLDATVAALQAAGCTFRTGVIHGNGGRQALVEDPSGNVVELFESKRDGVKPIPDGYHTVTPFLLADDVERLLAFIEAAFGGRVDHTMRSEDGVARHATIRVGSSLLMVSKGTDIYGRVPLMLHLYVDNVEQVYADALGAGGLSQREPQNEFYGDRVAAIKDTWENQWWIATHVEDVSDEELRRREKTARGLRADTVSLGN